MCVCVCVYVCVSVCACMRACVRVRASPRHPDRISGLCSHAAHAKSKGSEIKRTGFFGESRQKGASRYVRWDRLGPDPAKLTEGAERCDDGDDGDDVCARARE